MDQTYPVVIWMFDSPLMNLAIGSFSLFLLWRTVVRIVGFVRGG
jgi:hypothetical protein